MAIWGEAGTDGQAHGAPGPPRWTIVPNAIIYLVIAGGSKSGPGRRYLGRGQVRQSRDFDWSDWEGYVDYPKALWRAVCQVCPLGAGVWRIARQSSVAGRLPAGAPRTAVSYCEIAVCRDTRVAKRSFFFRLELRPTHFCLCTYYS